MDSSHIVSANKKRVLMIYSLDLFIIGIIFIGLLIIQLVIFRIDILWIPIIVFLLLLIIKVVRLLRMLLKKNRIIYELNEGGITLYAKTKFQLRWDEIELISIFNQYPADESHKILRLIQIVPKNKKEIHKKVNKFHGHEFIYLDITKSLIIDEEYFHIDEENVLAEYCKKHSVQIEISKPIKGIQLK
jgi:hypothetical protein